MTDNLRKKRALSIEDGVIVGGLIGVQFIYAGNALLLDYLMSLNLNPLSLVVYSSFATFLLLSPISVIFERKQWPSKFTLKLMIQLVFISFSGVTLFQSLFMTGLKMTSPAMATAMPNLAPALIFAIAWAFRLEKVHLRCLYSKVKIVGTLICVAGAIAMSLLQGTTSVTPGAAPVAPSSDATVSGDEKTIGGFYLITAVVVLSSNVVLQAHTLGDFPAPISLCAITSLIGVGLTAGLEFLQLRKFDTGWPAIGVGQLVGFSLLAGIITGVCVSFNGWAMKKRGPVLASMFSPISTVFSALFSVFTVGEVISLGSLGGMFLMFTGLYFVLWAKGKESSLPADGIQPQYDAEKPLLC